MKRRIKVIETHLASDNKLKEQPELLFAKELPEPDNQEAQILNIYDEVQYQEILGFGGAFTESTALNLRNRCWNCILTVRKESDIIYAVQPSTAATFRKIFIPMMTWTEISNWNILIFLMIRKRSFLPSGKRKKYQKSF